jgi:hypothetical protein
MSDIRKLTEEAVAKSTAFNRKQSARVAEAKIAAARTSKEPFSTEKLSKLLTSAVPMLDEMSDEELLSRAIDITHRELMIASRRTLPQQAARPELPTEVTSNRPTLRDSRISC